MIAVDTNILVRYLTRDDPLSLPLVDAFMEQRLTVANPGFVTTVTLCEVIWLLTSHYNVKRRESREIVAMLRELPQLVLEHDDCIEASLASEGAELADTVIHFVAKKRGCSHTVTLDKRFARLPGVELLS